VIDPAIVAKLLKPAVRLAETTPEVSKSKILFFAFIKVHLPRACRGRETRTNRLRFPESDALRVMRS
jgi:hypothetical protein